MKLILFIKYILKQQSWVQSAVQRLKPTETKKQVKSNKKDYKQY